MTAMTNIQMIGTRMAAAALLLALMLSAMAKSAHAQSSVFAVNAAAGAIERINVSTMQTESHGNAAAVGSAQAFVFVPGSNIAYVATTGNSVNAYDTTAQQVTATVALPAQPRSIVVNGSGTLAYVSVPSANAIAAISTATNSVAATVTVGSRPLGLALSRDGNRLYVANSGSQSISVINTANGNVTRTIALSGVDAADLAVTADDQFLLVTSVSGTTLSVTNLIFGDVFTTVPLGGVAQSVTITPDGTRIHVPTNNGVATIDTATFLTAGAMTDAGTPSAVAFNASGSIGYVADAGGGRLIAFDPSTLMPSSEMTLAAGVSAIALRRPMAPQTGWWWNTSESGRGYSLEVNGWKIFYSAYAYDAAGDPVWYVGYLAATDGESYTGDLLQYSGGQTLSGAYKPAQLAGTIGPMSLRFSSPIDGTATHAGTPMPLHRYDIIPNGISSGRGSGMPQSGWWYSSSEGGRGYFIETQSNSMFFAAFMYDDQGKAVWYYADGTVGPNATFQSPLHICRNGQPLLDMSGYKTPSCTADQGTITIRFTSGSTARLTLPNGNTLDITRYPF